MKRRAVLFIAMGLLLMGFAVGASLTFLRNPGTGESIRFSGDRAYADVIHQVDLGPRTPGSQAHADIIAWIMAELEQAGWQAEIQETGWMGQPIQNIVANRSSDPPEILLVAHYDSRLVADRDPDPARQAEPVPGANDGASGVAVLLELARTLPPRTARVGLLFTDMEDNGRLPGWTWAMGARAYVENLTEKPQSVIVVDMIGDADLQIYLEKNSDPALAKSIWTHASELGYGSVFISQSKHRLVDDHLPFMEAGIPAIDIIDFDYPYWHTTADTVDKVSAGSLQVVGDTLWSWIVNQP